MTSILRIDASMRRDNSTTRQLGDQLIAQLKVTHPHAAVTHRDLAEGVPLIDETWITANFTDAAQRSAEQHQALEVSDALIAEIKAADILVINVPIYNFGVPAALKAWIDQVARARVTFRYSENGPVGLLENKKAYVTIASGGTPAESAIDFASGYLRHVLGFIGIHDVEFFKADQQMRRGAQALSDAQRQIAALAA